MTLWHRYQQLMAFLNGGAPAAGVDGDDGDANHAYDDDHIITIIVIINVTDDNDDDDDDALLHACIRAHKAIKLLLDLSRFSDSPA